MKRLLQFFNSSKRFTKKDILSFKNYWQSRQSAFGYPGEDEKLFKEWLAKNN